MSRGGNEPLKSARQFCPGERKPRARSGKLSIKLFHGRIGLWYVKSMFGELCIWLIKIGFAALKPILLDSGVYSNFCKTDERTCKAQDTRLNLLFTVASSVTNVRTGQAWLTMTDGRYPPCPSELYWTEWVRAGAQFLEQWYLERGVLLLVWAL